MLSRRDWPARYRRDVGNARCEGGRAGRSGLVAGRKTLLDGEDGGLDAAGELELAQHVLDVDLHGALGEIELARDLLVALAAGACAALPTPCRSLAIICGETTDSPRAAVRIAATRVSASMFFRR